MAYTPLRAGELRTRVRIEAESRVHNGQGGFTTSWDNVATVWAKKSPLRGDEVVREGIVRAVSFSRFLIRFRTDVTVKHRLVEEVAGTVWNIRRVDDPYGRRDRLELDCESGVAT